MYHRGVLVAEIRRFWPYCDYGGYGRRVCFEIICVSEFTRAALPMRPKIVILLEIMIIVTNFNDVDLFNTYCSRRRVWCTMVTVERRWPLSLCLLLPSCLNFLQPVCVFVGCAFHVYPKGFKAFFGTGSWHRRHGIVCIYVRRSTM